MPLGQPGGHSLLFEKESAFHRLQPLEGSQFWGGVSYWTLPWRDGGLGFVLWPWSPQTSESCTPLCRFCNPAGAKACFRTLPILLGSSLSKQLSIFASAWVPSGQCFQYFTQHFFVNGMIGRALAHCVSGNSSPGSSFVSQAQQAAGPSVARAQPKRFPSALCSRQTKTCSALACHFPVILHLTFLPSPHFSFPLRKFLFILPEPNLAPLSAQVVLALHLLKPGFHGAVWVPLSCAGISP